MDGNNWRGPQQAQAGDGAGAPTGAPTGAMDSGEWRTQLLPDSRQRIVNKIMETLKRHLPEGVQELKKIAVRFEEKIYSAATSQQDYLRKISLKMLTMETKSQPNATNSGQSALGPEAASYETISGPEVSDEEEDDRDVSKEDGLEELAVKEEQKSAVRHKENVKVGENEDVAEQDAVGEHNLEIV